MDQHVSASVRSKRQVLRANPSQAAVLQEAYAKSSTVNNEIATELHHKTGLPPKWITQWFARRRSKERKRASDSALGIGPLDTVSSDAAYSPAAYSPSDSLQVKQEDRDNIVSSRSSSSFAPVSATESSHYLSGSRSTPQHATDSQPINSASTRGRKRKQTNAYMEMPAPVPQKRGRKRIDRSAAPLQVTQVKEEQPEASGSMSSRDAIPRELGTLAHTVAHYAKQTTEHPVLTDSGVRAASSSDFVPGRALRHTGFQIAPPKRSAKTPLRPKANTPVTDPSPAVNFVPATNEHQSDSHSGISVDAMASTPKGIYQRAPIFRMGFQNSGPGNFTGASETTQRSRSGAPASPVASTSQSTHLAPPPVMGVTFSPRNASDRNLRGNENPSEVPFPDFYDLHPTQTTRLQPWPPVLFNHEIPHFDLSMSDFESMDSFFLSGTPDDQQSQDIITDCHPLPLPDNDFDHHAIDNILDPSSAPLKHLVDILQDFRDEHGGFSRLRCPEEHPVLIQRLASQDLLEQSYFQAAMGHVLLIRLGILAD